MASNRHATLVINHCVFICVAISLFFPSAADDFQGTEVRLTREYHLSQGALRGLIVKASRQYNLQEVEMFLGIPYAAAPVGHLRFMPPVSAPPWSGIKHATKFAPVCPQALPPLKKGNPPTMGRQHYLHRLKPFLSKESEDCLYLNIYVPHKESRSKPFPVVVFIHGDSFEWGSGNSYDGRILAAYGNIMVVTLNFRLGILGFLKPSLTEHVYGNNGLLDQLAALQWIKDNIEELNGDPQAVTLMGHGAGGACVGFLMLSPISNDLFHRAILMSGTALSDWAMTKDPSQYTLQVAQSLGCNPTARDLMMCLQNKALADIKKVQILSREWETALGPMVAGSFIPNEPWVTMETFPTLLSKYQLLSGVTENERYHDFGVIELDHGILENQRDEFISKYVKLIYETADKHVLKEILDEYAPVPQDPGRWSVEMNRDVILSVFSDARTVAPMLSFANYQSKANSQSYFYVFGHNSVSTEYASLNKSVHGEELPYVFGIPLGGANTHFHLEYTQKEKLLSEVVMKLWSNFVKYGTPNTQSRNEYYTMGSKYWPQYNVDWAEYNVAHQSFLKLDIPPYISSNYRSNYTNFWNEVLPSKMKRYLVDPLFEFTPSPISSTQKPKPTHKNTETKAYGSQVFQPPPRNSLGSPTYGRVRPYSPQQHTNNNDIDKIYREIQSIHTPARRIPPGIFDRPLIRKPTTEKPKLIQPMLPKKPEPIVKSSATIAIIAGIVVFIVATNIGICTVMYIKKVKRRSDTCNSPRRPFSGEVDLIGQKANEDKKTLQNIKNGYTVIKTMNLKKVSKLSKKENKKQEQSKTPKSDDSGGFRERFKLRKHVSTSTLDAQTKVSNWIKNDMTTRSPTNSRKSFSETNIGDKSHPTYTRSEEILTEQQKQRQIIRNETLGEKARKDGLQRIKTSEKTTSTSALDSQSSLGSKKIYLGLTQLVNKSTESLKSAESSKSKKVSVAVDATPAGRKEEMLTLIHSNEIKSQVKNQNVETNKQVNEEILVSPVLLGKTTFTNEVTFTIDKEKPLKISHTHSKSDPVTDFNYTEIIQGLKDTAVVGKILPPVKFRNDINVTSRDEHIETTPISADEALQNMKRRKFPKVLPDHPDLHKRLSLQPTLLQTFSGSFDSQMGRPKNQPPQPPPRTSTLDRRFEFKNAKQLLSFDSCMKKINEAELLKKFETTHNLSPISSLNTIYVSNTPRRDPSLVSSIPKVIIAQPENILTSADQDQTTLSAPRIKLPDDFHSENISSSANTPFSSEFSFDLNDLDEIDDDEAEDKLIQELVGGVDSPTNMDDILDTKGPDTSYARKLEIVPVKIKTENTVPNYKDYVGITDLHLPNLSECAEQTAQIKSSLRLNKLQRRSDSIQRPPEKAIKVKHKPTYSSTVLFNKSYKKPKKHGDKTQKDRQENSYSCSSNDTEASTETVKRVEVKRDSNYS